VSVPGCHRRSVTSAVAATRGPAERAEGPFTPERPAPTIES
jgi:hypothetical protein